MGHRRFVPHISRWRLALSGAVGISLIATMSGAAAVGDDSASSTARFARIDPSLFDSSSQHLNFVPASLSDEPVDVVLELAGAPVAVQDAQAKSAGRKLSDPDKQAIRQQLADQQARLHGSLAAAGASVIGDMQDAYNGIHVTVAQRNLPQLASLPGVVAIHGVQSFTPDNTNAIPFINADTEWQSSGFTGQGVKIASIDTGIDFTHADFGGPGTVAAWNSAKAASTQAADPTMFGPAAPKVKGGFDFVGDAYDARNRQSRPMPDPNPLDCNGHGSHTAGSAAGFGVLSTGKTYMGPYNGTTISSNSWNVGPGVAPRASLYAYRVFGCAGSSNVVDLAINRAVADGVDVISMSLGSPLGGFDDPTSVASQNAFNDGITVVASAGNNGPGAYVVGSPSTANGVLSVAAIDGSVPQYPGATLLFSKTGKSIATIDANGAAVPSGTFPLKVLTNPDGTISQGCDKTQYAGTAGMVVVTARGNCARVARAVFGDEAGDAAVVMVNNSAGFPPFEGQITSNPDTGEQHTVTIPFLGAKSTDGAALLAANGGTVTLGSTNVPNSNYKLAANFSSGGPRDPDSAPKPDVMAPGVSVASVGMGTGAKAAVMSGTSMACPLTAGIAALVKEAHPTWRGEQIKAAIMNTADPSKNIGYNVRIAGTGVVQAQHAVKSSVLATTSDSLDSIAFGYVPGSGAYNALKSFTLTNYGTTSATYNLSVAGNGSQRGAVVAVSPASITVAAGSTATVAVMLSISAAAFAALPSDDTFSIGPASVLTVRGDILATPAAGDSADDQTIRVPYLLAPRGLSNVTAGAPAAFANTATTGTPGHTITSTLPLQNSGIHGGLADLYAWGIHKASDRGGSPIDIRDVGVQVAPGMALGSTKSDRALVFLINTYGRATNQSISEFDVVISVNGDSSPDFVVVGFDLGQVLGGSFNGEYASFTINAHTHALVDAFLADAPMNGSTIELPALASDLGLSAKSNGIGPVKQQGITYHVNSFALKKNGFDTTGSTTINPFSPSVSSGDFHSIAAGAGDSMPLTVDTDQQFAQPALGWLVASVDNANGAAQALEVPAPT